MRDFRVKRGIFGKEMHYFLATWGMFEGKVHDLPLYVGFSRRKCVIWG